MAIKGQRKLVLKHFSDKVTYYQEKQGWGTTLGILESAQNEQ